MGLVVPKLDDRQFQDIVDEAKKRIPLYCPEWTDHNVSDPGVTLIELFAWMTDLMLYRLNQVPDLHYIKFMEMMGITLGEPAPAKVPVTFWLSASQPTAVVIPAGTEVASTQTETQPSIVFTTDGDLCVQPPLLRAVLSRLVSRDGENETYNEHNLRRLVTGFQGVDVFSSKPRAGDALYFGFENDPSQHILRFDMELDPAGGTGVAPTMPPYLWEASTGSREERWHACQVETDTTQSMNGNGRIQIHLPRMGRLSVHKQEFYWVRARNKEISASEYREGMRPYEKSPRLRKVLVTSRGGTVSATHARLVSKEFLGQSDGSTGQVYQLQFTPILARKTGETLAVHLDGEPPQTWVEVSDFAESGAYDHHFTLDSVSGELRLGPAVRQPDGTIKLYGAVPPRGANLVYARYRYGGGEEGNVQAGVLNTLKTSIPYVARVANQEPAWGGLDAETLESARMRAPAMLRSRERAVTESDYEFLAHQALPAAIGRVKCLQPRPSEAGRVVPGQVYVLVIPRVPHPEGFLEPDQLKLKEEDMMALTAFLDERRLLTTRLDIRPPAYHWVAARAELRAVPGADPSQVEADVLARLYHFLNPLSGGPDGGGWPFGRDLYVSDVYQCLQGLPNVQFIRSVKLHAVRPGAEAQGEAVEQVEVLAHGVIASSLHSVAFT